MDVGGGEEDLGDRSGDKSCCRGCGSRRSGNGKVDDGADEARRRDERILVRRRGLETSISCSGRRGRGSGSGKVEDGVADRGGWPQCGGCRAADGV